MLGEMQMNTHATSLLWIEGKGEEEDRGKMFNTGRQETTRERVRAKMFIGETMQFNLIVRKKTINRYQFKG